MDQSRVVEGIGSVLRDPHSHSIVAGGLEVMS